MGRVAVTDLDVYPNNQMNFYLNTICTYATSSIDSLLELNNETGVFTLNYAVDAEGDVVNSLDAIVIVIDPTVNNRFEALTLRILYIGIEIFLSFLSYVLILLFTNLVSRSCRI